jgi:COP9 signalosome complex subunit 2
LSNNLLNLFIEKLKMSDDEELILDEDGNPIEDEIEDEEIEFEGGSEDDKKEDNEEEDEEELMENTYYGAKGEDNIDDQLDQFINVLEMEEKKGKWGFKSLNQMIKIYNQKKDYKKVIETYKRLLTYMNIVTRNESETSINKILTLFSTNASSNEEQTLLGNIYSITLDVLKNDIGNDVKP